MKDLLINLAASVIAGLGVWLGQRVARRRRLARQRAFFGLQEDAETWLVVPRHASSPREFSVNRRDVAALVELAALVRSCGGRPALVFHDEARGALGATPEFCVGGPAANERTAAHLRWILRGVQVEDYAVSGEELTFRIGRTEYRRKPGEVEYVLVAKVLIPDRALPAFIICGQVAGTNQAAAHYLSTHWAQLARRYRNERFCLLLRIAASASYGYDFVENVQDVTGDAFTSP